MKRQIIIDGDVAFIPLTRGHVAIIDAADVPLVDGCNWYARETGNTVYAVRMEPIGCGKQLGVYLHRAILGLGDAHVQADHIDGDGLNNRRSNLRACTLAENSRNGRIGRNNSSGFKGVHLHPKSGKWRAQIRLNRRRKHLGLFDTPQAAHDAYCAAAAELHGEFARAA